MGALGWRVKVMKAWLACPRREGLVAQRSVACPSRESLFFADVASPCSALTRNGFAALRRCGTTVLRTDAEWVTAAWSLSRECHRRYLLSLAGGTLRCTTTKLAVRCISTTAVH